MSSAVTARKGGTGSAVPALSRGLMSRRVTPPVTPWDHPQPPAAIPCLWGLTGTEGSGSWGLQMHGDLRSLSKYRRAGALGTNRGGIGTNARTRGSATTPRAQHKGGAPQGRGAGGTPRALPAPRLAPSQQEEEAARERGVGEEEEEEDGAAASKGEPRGWQGPRLWGRQNGVVNGTPAGLSSDTVGCSPSGTQCPPRAVSHPLPCTLTSFPRGPAPLAALATLPQPPWGKRNRDRCAEQPRACRVPSVTLRHRGPSCSPAGDGDAFRVPR